jgi:hypothetical protein
MFLQIFCVLHPEHYICELPLELFTYDLVEQSCNHVKCSHSELPYIIEEVHNDLKGVNGWSRDLLEVFGVITPGTLFLAFLAFLVKGLQCSLL